MEKSHITSLSIIPHSTCICKLCSEVSTEVLIVGVKEKPQPVEIPICEWHYKVARVDVLGFVVTEVSTEH